MTKRMAVIGPDKEFFSVIRKNVLGFYPEISWVEFDNGFEFIAHCLNTNELPEIVFTEMFLFKIDGITVTDYLRTYLPDIGVVCVVDELDDNVISNVLEVGAVGLMNKSDTNMFYKITQSNDDVCRIIKTTLNDITSIHSAAHNSKHLFHYRNKFFAKYGITKRESLFLLLNATGLEYGEIATLMFISRKTVDNLFNSVAKKLGVQNRHNLTLFCIKMRLAKFSTVNTATTPKYSLSLKSNRHVQESPMDTDHISFN